MVFLTSAGFLNPMVLNIVLEDRKSKIKSACIIATGILPDKEKHPIAQNSKRFLLESSIDIVDFLDVELQDPSVLPDYDLILILGGNSNHLFYHLKRSGADKYILECIQDKKDVIGVSAGAWFLSSGRHFADDFKFVGIDETYPKSMDNNGLNIIPINIFPHYDMFCEKVENLEEKLKAVENRREVEIVRLKNMDFIYKDNLGEIHKIII